MFGIYYFSGTGNTKYVAELLHQEISSELFSIEAAYDVKDTLILMYPIYGLGTPRIMLEFAKNLPNANKKVYIIKTAADFISVNNAASDALISILELKGYKIQYDRIVVMPSNFFLEYDKNLSKALIDVAPKKVKHIAKDIRENKYRRYRTSSIMRGLYNLVWLGESKIGSFFFSKSLRIKESCTSCMKCVKNCPTGNIDESLRFHGNCVFCMRCVYNCPVNAIYSKGMNKVIFKNGYSLKVFDNAEGDVNYTGYYKHFKKYIEDIEV